MRFLRYIAKNCWVYIFIVVFIIGMVATWRVAMLPRSYVPWLKVADKHEIYKHEIVVYGDKKLVFYSERRIKHIDTSIEEKRSVTDWNENFTNLLMRPVEEK